MEELLIEEEEVTTEKWSDEDDRNGKKEDNVCPICGKPNCWIGEFDLTNSRMCNLI